MRYMAALSALPPLRLDSCDRNKLKAYFLNSWELYETLKSSIQKPEHFYEAPDPRRRPLIFYLGHTAAFYLNKLKMAGAIESGLDSRLDQLLAVGVDPERPEDLDEPDWPTVGEVWEYRNKVKQIVLNFIEKCDLPGKADPDHPVWALLMGIEHERIHFETSSVLIRQYPAHYLKRPAGWTYAPSNLNEVGKPHFTEFQGGTVRLGKQEAEPTYGWDNEYGDLDVVVAPFALAKNMVTNGEFLKFVEAGGYTKKELWQTTAWNRIQKKDQKAPAFWVETEKGYAYRAQFDEIPMPQDWPVEVTAEEALAYCRWKGPGYRLMSEAEFHIAAQPNHCPNGDPAYSDRYNLNMRYGSPHAVGSLKHNDDCQVNDLYGNVWDWLSDDFYPLPGFQAHPWYKNFSNLYFDEDHAMLLGGSWASCGGSASKYYRLWFRRNFVQHAGFRLAQTLT